jgi:hypothetical protein
MTRSALAKRVQHDIRHELRVAFRTIITDGKHRINGEFVGYQKLGDAVGVKRSTVWRWMAQDFPEISWQISWERRKGGSPRELAGRA